MPTIRKDLIGEIIGSTSGGLIFYDPIHIGFPLIINLSVDITGPCPKLQKIKHIRLDYAIDSKKKKCVVITKCHRNSDKGSHVCYDLPDLKKPDAIFKQWAKDFGLTPKKLRDIIQQYAKNIK